MRILHFPPVSQLLDEDARLCSLSVFDAFRLLQDLVTVPEDEREAMFFGGLFAYDLVAGLKICRKPSRATAARTTASIWPKPCW
jgi:anthranilate synthase component 1